MARIVVFHSPDFLPISHGHPTKQRLYFQTKGCLRASLHELPDGPVRRIPQSDLQSFCAVWFEIVRYHIRGMVADEKQYYGKERLSFFCFLFRMARYIDIGNRLVHQKLLTTLSFG